MPTEFDDLLEPDKLWDDEIERADPAGLSAGELDNFVHTLLARRLVERLQSGNPTPGDFQAALRFLKDNDIGSLPVPGSAHEALRQKLSPVLPFPRLTEDTDAGNETSGESATG